MARKGGMGILIFFQGLTCVGLAQIRRFPLLFIQYDFSGGAIHRVHGNSLSCCTDNFA